MKAFFQRLKLEWHSFVLILPLIAGMGYRFSLHENPALSITNYDTIAYVGSGEIDFFSLDFFTSNRPATISLTYKLLEPKTEYQYTNLVSPAENIKSPKTYQPGFDRVAITQAIFSTLTWSLLAVVIYRQLRQPFLKLSGALLVLLFAFSPQLADWDSILMSESISISFYALVLALTLELTAKIAQVETGWDRSTKLLMAVWLLVVVFWIFARDTNAYMLLVFAVVLGLGLLIPKLRPHFNLSYTLVVVALLLGLFFFHNRTLFMSSRWINPFFNNLLRDVLPYADRTQFFTDNGMPLTDEMLGFVDGPGNQKGFFEIEPLVAWVNEKGSTTYLKFILSKPAVTWERFISKAALVFSENTQPFFIPDYEVTPRWVFFMGDLLHPKSNSVYLAAALACLGFLISAHRSQSRALVGLAWIGAFFLLGQLGLLFMSLMGDALGLVRHAMGTAIHLRLSLWVFSCFILDGIGLAMQKTRP
ncbi:MAG: hypothetical protein JXB38_09385 [Anaerolineales bacterium]|nr:hypothetical protein [Anaerolineales bacterium]